MFNNFILFVQYYLTLLYYISNLKKKQYFKIAVIILINFPFSRSTPPVVFFGKGVLKICCKLTGEHPQQSAISIKLLCDFIEIGLRHGCSPVNLLYIFRTTFSQNTFEGLLLFLLKPEKNNEELYFQYFHLPILKTFAYNVNIA